MTDRDSVFTGSLFERITGAASPPRYRVPPNILLRSIRNNLRRILNSRPDSCCGSPELGIIDLNDESLMSSDFRNEISRCIQRCIRRYEPRLSEVSVTAASTDEYSPLELRFHIVAYVCLSDSRDVLEFDILLDSRRHYCVE